jgi:predicted peroxiredoxin
MQSASAISTSPRRADLRTQGGTYAVILASGPQDGSRRVTLAMAAACTVQAMDVETIVFMVGDGVPLKRRPAVRQTGMAAALIYAVKGNSVTF